MGVAPGSPVSASNTNAHLIDSDQDDATTGILGLQNTTVPSGPTVVNTQGEINGLNTFSGRPAASGPASLPTWTNNDVGLSTDTLKQRSDDLTLKFNGTTGHKHTGNPGDAPLVPFLTGLSGIQLYGYKIQGVNLTGVTGTTWNVSTPLVLETPSTAQTIEGVVVNAPSNVNQLLDSSGSSFLDGSGNQVYGRLTNTGGIGGTWTLSFYSLLGGTETAYNFVSSTTMQWFYQKLFNETNRPVYSDNFEAASDLIAGTIPDATTTVKGKVLLATAVPQPVGGTPASGVGPRVAMEDHVHLGLRSLSTDLGVTKIYADCNLIAGTNMALTQVGQDITIDGQASTIGYQEVPIGTVNGSNTTFGPLTYPAIDVNSVIVFVDFLAVPHAGWNLVTNSIVFNAGYIPQPGQSVYAFYLLSSTLVSPPPPAGVEFVEYPTLSPTDISVKYVTLSATPANSGKVMLDVISGGPQQYGVDFVVTGTQLSWSGLGLDGLLVSGNVLRIHYFS